MTVKEYNNAVDLHADSLYRFVLKNIKNVDKAKDIIQDTFEKTWIKRDQINNEKAKSYLFTTAYHNLVDLTRREQKQGDYNEKEALKLNHETQYSDLQEILHEAIDKLPIDQKAVIMLRDYEGYAYNEIAEITGLNESQVKVYIFRARKQLKAYIGSIDAVI
jgi:RNA polymerase sigma factor (sigma-70 family)